MKKLKLTKLISYSLIAMSLLTLYPIGASAEWRQGNQGWWYAEGNSWSIGWRLINGNWYYFDNNGYMLHDTVIDGCYLNSSGAWNQGLTSNITSGNTGLDSNLSQYLSNPDELKQSFQNYINSNQQNTNNDSLSSGEQSVNSSSTINFLETQKKVAQDTIDSCESQLNDPYCMETLKPSLRQTISKCENTIAVINEKEQKLRN